MLEFDLHRRVFESMASGERRAAVPCLDLRGADEGCIQAAELVGGTVALGRILHAAARGCRWGDLNCGTSG
jgi:hypothetical protein